MYHSINFIRASDIYNDKQSSPIEPYIKNTYDDWSLVPVSRPSVSPPQPKTKYVDIPGANSQLDFSTSLTGYPVYQNRNGSWEFMIDRDHTNKSWSDIYSEIMDWIQGKEMCCILEDDKSWYYKGRFYVSALTSENQYTTIQINYDVYPYKKYAVLGPDYGSDWIWDVFDFVDGIIPSMITRDIIVNSSDYKNYEIQTTSSEEWYSIFGNEPIIPIIKITTESDDYIQIKFKNFSLNKPSTGYFESEQLTTGEYRLRNIIFGGECREKYIPKYYPGTDILMGDADSDGKVTSNDASKVLIYATDHQGDFTSRERLAADMDFDGKITAADASLILKLYSELGELPVNYTLSINNTLMLQFKGKGTISFLFVPGRL